MFGEADTTAGDIAVGNETAADVAPVDKPAGVATLCLATWGRCAGEPATEAGFFPAGEAETAALFGAADVSVFGVTFFAAGAAVGFGATGFFATGASNKESNSSYDPETVSALGDEPKRR